MEKPKSLKKKTIGGMLWSFGDLMGNQGIQFIIQIILARMLLPEHFGLIGMILVFVAISNTLIDSGFSQALIREQNVTQIDYSTVFYFNLVVSIVIYLGLFALAPTVSVFFGEPELINIIRILALSVIINAFGIIPKAMFTKEVNFRSQAKVNLSASIASGLVAVAFAVSGFGVWSLVVRTLALSLIQSLLLSLSKKWLPSPVFNKSSFKRLFGFGWKLLISSLINTIYTNIYFLIIGKYYSAGQLGYYTNASKFSDAASQTMTAAIQRVTYPVLSSMQDENVRLKQNYKKVMKLAAFIIFPLMAGLGAIGEPLIHLIFGEQWAPMTIYFQLLCIAGMLYPIHALNLNILQVKGRSDLFLYLEIIKMMMSLFLIFLVFWQNLGIIGLVGVIILDNYLALFINTYFSAKEISYSMKEQLNDLFPIYLISMVMGGSVYLVGELLPDYMLLKLIIQISTGVAFYLLSSKLLKITELSTVFELVLPVIKKIKFAKTN